MKKICAILASLLCFTAVFAQSIPEGRDLFVFALEFSQDSDSWTEAKVSKFDIMEDEYVVSGYCVNKNIIGWIKQEYDVVIKGNGDTFDLFVENMNSVACDKNGNVRNSSKKIANPQSTMDKLAGLIMDAVGDKLASWSDEEYAEKYNNIIKNPSFWWALGKNTNNLYTSKFVEKNNLIGSEISLPVTIYKISENKMDKNLELFFKNKEVPEVYSYAYQVSVEYNVKDYFDLGTIDEFGLLPATANVFITFYSNDDDFITKKEGSNVEITGTIEELKFDDFTNKISRVVIYEK